MPVARLSDGDPSRGPALVGSLGIEAAADAVGVSPSALRLWERQGLVRPARTPGGIRRYATSDVERLRAIHRWRTVDGLNAAAIRRLLDSGEDGRAGSGSAARPDRATHHPSESTAAGRGSQPIAARLRALRTRQRMTLRDAARASGLSASFISALERGVTGGSIAALRRLTMAYEATLGDLFEERAVGRLVAPSERRVLDTGSGVRIEQLASASVSLEPQLFLLAPGASSEGAYSHPGEEFMFVLDGEVGVWLGEAEFYRLVPGDALTFPSTVTHRFQALGAAETRLLWVNTPPTF